MKGLLHRIAGGFYMLVESVGMSVANITQNRLRSFLTILGILIAIGVIVLVGFILAGIFTLLGPILILILVIAGIIWLLKKIL